MFLFLVTKKGGDCNFHFVVQDLCLPKLVKKIKRLNQISYALLGPKKKSFALYYYIAKRIAKS